jgi:hypothetical protein
MWSAWSPLKELEEKYGLDAATVERWAKVGYAQLQLRKPDGRTPERCARIRGFLGTDAATELRMIGQSVKHAERCKLVAGAKA